MHLLCVESVYLPRSNLNSLTCLIEFKVLFPTNWVESNFFKYGGVWAHCGYDIRNVHNGEASCSEDDTMM